MREVDSPESSGGEISRRRYTQVLAGASIASLAGCLGSGDDTGDETGDNEEESGLQRETLRVHINNIPSQANLNTFAADPQGEGSRYWEELSAPMDVFTLEPLLDGHTWEATWADEFDEISIPTMYTGYDIDAPYDITTHFNEELTYWDGETPIDAHAKEYEELLEHYTGNDEAVGEESVEFEAIDQFSFLRSYDNPRTDPVLEHEAVPTHDDVPPHPDFTEPYVEEYRDATTDAAHNEITERLEAETIDLYDLADEEWGSGLYKLDPDRMTDDRMIAEKRDDHPNEHATVPEVEYMMAETEQYNSLANNGQIDLGQGVVQADEGSINRETLPDHVQELDRYLQQGGDHFLLNWKNEHLQNLWVRRAIFAAIDWYDVGANGWGPENSTPNEYHICMTDSMAEIHFDQEFLDQLYQYPIEQDLELAADWLRRAGYSGSMDDGWESPAGEPLVLSLDVNNDQPDWIGGSQTIEVHLQQLGIDLDYVGLDQATWESRYAAENNIYDMGIFWTPDTTPWNFYDSNGQWWSQPLLGGDPDSGWAGDTDWQNHGEVDNHGRPFEQEIPTEVGSINAPTEAGRQPSLADGELVNLPALCEALRNPDLEIDFDTALEKLAQYANFYLPFFTFHSYTWGTWGNVRDFRFPERGHDAHHAWKEFSSESYHTLGGIVQVKHDTEFPDPGTGHSDEDLS